MKSKYNHHCDRLSFENLNLDFFRRNSTSYWHYNYLHLSMNASETQSSEVDFERGLQQIHLK